MTASSGLGLYAVVARFDLLPEGAEEFDELARWRIGEAASEPGLVGYGIHRIDGEPLARVFYEVYRDHDAFLAHRATSQTAEFLEKHGRYVRGAPRMELLEPLHVAGRLADPPDLEDQIV